GVEGGLGVQGHPGMLGALEIVGMPEIVGMDILGIIGMCMPGIDGIPGIFGNEIPGMHGIPVLTLSDFSPFRSKLRRSNYDPRYQVQCQSSLNHSSAVRPASTMLVLWQTPSGHWMKANTDGSVFRDYMANFRGGCAQKFSGVSVLHAEIVALILAMELAHKKKWHYLWVESDCVAAN
ncbi:hypothetical protein L195_g043148, partial [Trifolium pratense]